MPKKINYSILIKKNYFLSNKTLFSLYSQSLSPHPPWMESLSNLKVYLFFNRSSMAGAHKLDLLLHHTPPLSW